MAEYTSVTITCAETDEPKVLKAFNRTPGTNDRYYRTTKGGIATLVINEVKYGGYGPMEGLALMGVAFLAHAEAGCDYHEAVIAGCGTRYAEVVAIDRTPVCAMKENGKPDCDGMKPVRRYYQVRRQAVRIFDRIRKRNI